MPPGPHARRNASGLNKSLISLPASRRSATHPAAVAGRATPCLALRPLPPPTAHVLRHLYVSSTQLPDSPPLRFQDTRRPRAQSPPSQPHPRLVPPPAATSRRHEAACSPPNSPLSSRQLHSQRHALEPCASAPESTGQSIAIIRPFPGNAITSFTA